MRRRQATGALATAVLSAGMGLDTTALAANVAGPRRDAPPAPLPPGYVVVGRRHGIPPLVLYGVALQESKMHFGDQALPFPWTLCVRGEARRFATYEAAVSDLRRSVAAGISNVDCGCMQVNWHWHNDKLGSFWRALDPYPNLEVGATILLEALRRNNGNWFAAVGEYHTGPIATAEQRARAHRYASAMFARLPSVPKSMRTATQAEGPHGAA